jgi:hypothetical protein
METNWSVALLASDAPAHGPWVASRGASRVGVSPHRNVGQSSTSHECYPIAAETEQEFFIWFRKLVAHN